MPELPPSTPAPPHPPDVTLVERTARSVDPDAWDRFVRDCGGSFLGNWRVIRANQFLSRVRVFDFFTSTPDGARQVGQCALAIGRGRLRFLDRLHLLAGYEGLWDRCMRLVMARCGDGFYEYGSAWNAEVRQAPPSQPGAWLTDLRADRPFLVDFVDFSRWSGFEDYRRAVSENIRRDYKKALSASAVVEVRRGLAALGDLPALIRLRGEVMARNQERHSAGSDLGRHLLKLLCLGDAAFIATVRAEGRCPSAFFGVESGDALYYVAGGTERNDHGYGSFLFLTLIERWVSAHPAGRLYLGRQSACVDPSEYTRGNQLYRRKLRAQSVPGTAFGFRLSHARKPAARDSSARMSPPPADRATPTTALTS